MYFECHVGFCTVEHPKFSKRYKSGGLMDIAAVPLHIKVSLLITIIQRAFLEIEN